MGPLALSLRKLLWYLYLLFPCPLPKFHYSDTASLLFLPPTPFAVTMEASHIRDCCKGAALNLSFQLIYRIPPLPLPASSQSCREQHAGSLLPWLWGSIPLCPHTDQEWRALLLPPLPLLTLEEGNVCNFQISDVPALTGPWIRVEQSQDYKGGPSDCRVCEKRVGRSPLLQSPCPKTKKLYCLLGEGWLSI